VGMGAVPRDSLRPPGHRRLAAQPLFQRPNDPAPVRRAQRPEMRLQPPLQVRGQASSCPRRPGGRGPSGRLLQPGRGPVGRWIRGCCAGRYRETACGRNGFEVTNTAINPAGSWADYFGRGWVPSSRMLRYGS
jgi:hypothetical protein